MQPTAGKLAANMKAAGIDATKIDTILISHFHPDHIFGLMEKDTNKPVHPNAEVIVSDVEYKFWTDPAVIDRLPEARRDWRGASRPYSRPEEHQTGDRRARGGDRHPLRRSARPYSGHRAFHLLVRQASR